MRRFALLSVSDELRSIPVLTYVHVELTRPSRPLAPRRRAQDRPTAQRTAAQRIAQTLGGCYLYFAEEGV